MIDYTKIISECCQEGAVIFAEQINGMHEGAHSYCFVYFHRQAKKYSQFEFISEGEFYAMCLFNIRSYKAEISESDNKHDNFLSEDILPIMEKSLTELISQKDLKTDQQKEKGDKIETPSEEKFKDLRVSGLPTIERIDPMFIFEKYHNNAFECSIDAFYAWLVYGKEYKESIRWIFCKKGRKVISKAQLKMFIDKITNTDEAKKAYFKKVFGITINKSDYRNASLDPYFKDLSTEIDRIKLNIK